MSTTSAPPPQPPAGASPMAHRRRIGQILLVLWLVLMLVVVFVLLTSRSKTNGRDNRPSTYSSGPVTTPNFVSIQARVIDVDPQSDIMLVRLLMVPSGSYALPSGALTVPLDLDVSGVPGGHESFAANQIPVPVESSVGMAGDLSQYPLDKYTSLLVVEVSNPKTNTLVPVHLTVSAGQRDWAVTPSNSPIVQGNAITVSVELQRGPATIGFAMFEMAVMLILAGIALAITYTTVIAGRQLEFSYFTWLGALIFALPAVRNSLPGSPSIGTLADSVVFFPALATVTVCMLAAAVTFVRRSHAKE